MRLERLLRPIRRMAVAGLAASVFSLLPMASKANAQEVTLPQNSPGQTLIYQYEEEGIIYEMYAETPVQEEVKREITAAVEVHVPFEQDSLDRVCNMPVKFMHNPKYSDYESKERRTISHFNHGTVIYGFNFFTGFFENRVPSWLFNSTAGAAFTGSGYANCNEKFNQNDTRNDLDIFYEASFSIKNMRVAVGYCESRQGLNFRNNPVSSAHIPYVSFSVLEQKKSESRLKLSAGFGSETKTGDTSKSESKLISSVQVGI